MKKFIYFDWPRAVQFLGNTVPKKISSQFLNVLMTHVYLWHTLCKHIV